MKIRVSLDLGFSISPPSPSFTCVFICDRLLDCLLEATKDVIN
jgi:hypothetical protein